MSVIVSILEHANSVHFLKNSKSELRWFFPIIICNHVKPSHPRKDLFVARRDHLSRLNKDFWFFRRIRSLVMKEFSEEIRSLLGGHTNLLSLSYLRLISIDELQPFYNSLLVYHVRYSSSSGIKRYISVNTYSSSLYMRKY